MTDKRQTPYGLMVVLIAFSLLGVLYSVAVPIFEKPDEPFHFFFIEHLLRERQLPDMRNAEESLWEQEGSQPPLYYLLAAITISPVDLSDAADLYWVNPQRNMGNPGRPGNKNFIVHTDQENWPFQDAVLAVQMARWLSLVFGGITIWVIYTIAKEILPGEPRTAVCAAAVTAFIPQFLFICSSVSNDSLITFLSATTLLQLIRIIKHPLDKRTGSLILLGIMVGLAALTKLSGLALWGLSALVLSWRAWKQQSWRTFLVSGLLVGGLAAAIAGWWYIRNIQLYGDISGLNLMLDALGNRRDPFVVTFQSVRNELVGLRASFWGLFGWFGILMPNWIYNALDILTLLGIVGTIRWFLRRRTEARWLLAFMLLWLVMALISLTQWTLMIASSQGRLLFPSLPGIILTLAIGWNQLLPSRFNNWISTGVAAALLLLSITLPFWLIAPTYLQAPLSSQNELPTDLDRLDVEFGDQLRLFGCQLGQTVIRPGETLAVTCYWQATRAIQEDYFGFYHLLGRNLEPVGKEHGYHGSGTFPTSLWPSKQLVASTEWVTIDRDAPAPTLGRLAVGVFQPDNDEQLIATSQGAPIELIIAGQVKIAPWKGEQTPIPNPILYNLGDIATLSGYDVTWNEELKVTLYWEPLTIPPEDYTIFAHLLDSNGNLQATGDGPPMNGDYPTSYWEPGEVIIDEHLIPVAADTSPNAYQLAVGLYRPADGARLPVWDTNGIPLPDNRIILPIDP